MTSNVIPESFFHPPPPPLAEPNSNVEVEEATAGEVKDVDAMEEDDKATPAAEASIPPPPTQTQSPSRIVPVFEEQPQPRSTTGASTGTQIAPVTELASRTVVLDTDVGDVLHSFWSPTDATRLATAGSETSTRIWKLTSAESSVVGDIKTSQVTLARRTDVPLAVSAMSWHPQGSIIAVATHNINDIFDNEITIWRDSGVLACVLPKSLMPALDLRWSPSGAALLGVCASDLKTDVFIWESVTGDILDTVIFDDSVERAKWLDESRFFLMGSRVLVLYRFDGKAHIVRRFTIPHEDNLELLQYDHITQLIATATTGGSIDVSFW